jgi:hypothetical protein
MGNRELPRRFDSLLEERGAWAVGPMICEDEAAILNEKLFAGCRFKVSPEDVCAQNERDEL